MRDCFNVSVHFLLCTLYWHIKCAVPILLSIYDQLIMNTLIGKFQNANNVNGTSIFVLLCI